MIDQRSREIIAQTAVKIAGDMAGKLGAPDRLEEFSESAYAKILDLIQGDSPAQVAPVYQMVPNEPEAEIVQAFNATPVVDSGSTDEDLWRDFFNNPGDWYDNIGDPKAKTGGGKGPDIKHKTLKDKTGQYALGLWVDGRGTPKWVKERLAS